MRKSPMEFGALVARTQDDARRDGPIIRETADQLFAEPYSRLAEKRIRTRRRVILAAALSAACAAAGLVIYFTTRPLPLGITFDGATVARPMGMFVEAAPSEEKPIRFTDGSRVVLAPSASARIIDTSEDGASVLVERGEVDVSVVHRDDTRWRFDVGPYTVRVTGTAFVVSWHPDTGLFSLTLSEGSVEVTGPALVKSRSVVAGETLRAWPRERKVMMVSNDRRSDTSPSQTERSVARTPTPVVAISAPPMDNASSAVAKERLSNDSITKTEKEGRGNFQGTRFAPPKGKEESPAQPPRLETARVAAEPTTTELAVTKVLDTPAEPATKHISDSTDIANVTKVLDTPAEPAASERTTEKAPPPLINKKIPPILTVPEGVGPNDLLKQAARERAAGEFESAKQSYAVIRSGFPSTQAAAAAAFSLGRIAYDVSRDYDAAIDWFRTFLAEARGHALKREAMGRLMESYVKADRRSDAADLAERYLLRYPDGPHAPLARSIIDE